MLRKFKVNDVRYRDRTVGDQYTWMVDLACEGVRGLRSTESAVSEVEGKNVFYL